jgi:hypothetical protein
MMCRQLIPDPASGNKVLVIRSAFDGRYPLQPSPLMTGKSE